MKGMPHLAPDRRSARTVGFVLFGLGFVLLIQGYEGIETPWPLKLLHPLA